MPKFKNVGSKHNWSELEIEFRNSKYKNVSTFFKNEKGWNSKQVTAGNFLRQTANWSTEKEMILKTNYISKLIDNEAYREKSLELLERSKIKSYVVDKIQVSKLAALESLHLGLMVVLTDLQAGKLGSVDFLKYSKSLLDVIRFGQLIDSESEGVELNNNGLEGGLVVGLENQEKIAKIHVQAYTPATTQENIE